MRVTHRKMLDAIREHKHWKGKNTKVYPQDGYSEVWLFDKHIADVYPDRVEVNEYTLKQWPTVTTMARLRALGVNVYQRNWVVYLNGRPI